MTICLRLLVEAPIARCASAEAISIDSTASSGGIEFCLGLCGARLGDGVSPTRALAQTPNNNHLHPAIVVLLVDNWVEVPLSHFGRIRLITNHCPAACRRWR